MKKITLALVAHVDAGKTTLSEALLFTAGNLRKLGRVDHGDAFLDPDQLEKKRGITIFSHEAVLKTTDLEADLLDTPGHVDFAYQTEETFSVLDYAILVISRTDGVTSYTRLLWRLLQKQGVPVFIFVNKMDTPGATKKKLLQEIQTKLATNAVDFTQIDQNFYEDIATADEKTLKQFLTVGKLTDAEVQELIKKRKIFPVYFGSALKLTGITALLKGLTRWSQPRQFATKFAARCFKISHDQQGERLTWLRVLGGKLKAKMILNAEKIDQLRQYNGEKYFVCSQVAAGTIVAVTGLSKTFPGQGLGTAQDINPAQLKPVLTYQVNPQNNEVHICLKALRELEDEDPQLQVTWSEPLQEIHVQIMGEVQLEILQQLMQERFKLKVTFSAGSILYQETILQKVEGVGHFEPLRHYAEVHLLLEPGQRNSGLVFANKCNLEVLSKSWQHQVMTALASKKQLGVLIGAPITDMKITLIGGKANLVHSVGGDFREATYRAVRQGLMELKARQKVQLLEPWYDFRLEVGSKQVGRALNDIELRHGHYQAPQAQNGLMVITGSAPVATMRGYVNKVRSYTHGAGSLECVVAGYFPCHNAAEIIAQQNYDPVADLKNTPNSVFCAHGAGHTVEWNQVPQKAHYPYQYPLS